MTKQAAHEGPWYHGTGRPGGFEPGQIVDEEGAQREHDQLGGGIPKVYLTPNPQHAAYHGRNNAMGRYDYFGQGEAHPRVYEMEPLEGLEHVETGATVKRARVKREVEYKLPNGKGYEQDAGDYPWGGTGTDHKPAVLGHFEAAAEGTRFMPMHELLALPSPRFHEETGKALENPPTVHSRFPSIEEDVARSPGYYGELEKSMRTRGQTVPIAIDTTPYEDGRPTLGGGHHRIYFAHKLGWPGLHVMDDPEFGPEGHEVEDVDWNHAHPFYSGPRRHAVLEHFEAGRTLDLYHHTSPEAAQALASGAPWEADPDTDDLDPRVYLSDRPHEEAARHGPAAVHVRVPASLAEVDDEFPSGEIHYTVPLDRSGHIKVVGLEPKQAAHALGGCKEEWHPGERAHFEYHCLESDDSNDAELWHRSHQQVEVLHRHPRENTGGWEGSTFAERTEEGAHDMYHIRFGDGHEGDVFEDELVTHPKHFYRPDPPARHQASARPGRGEKQCPCCKGNGEHGDGSECDPCDGQGIVHLNEPDRYCPGQPQPRRRHWREGVRAEGHTAAMADNEVPPVVAHFEVAAMAWNNEHGDKGKYTPVSVRDAGFAGLVGDTEDERSFREETGEPEPGHRDPWEHFDEDLHDHTAPEPTEQERREHEEDGESESYTERHDQAYENAFNDRERKIRAEDAPDHEDPGLRRFREQYGSDTELWKRHGAFGGVSLKQPVYATQSHVAKEHIEKYTGNRDAEGHAYALSPDRARIMQSMGREYLGDKHPLFVTHEGRVHVIEGHHRVATDMATGRHETVGWHFNLDAHPALAEENQGEYPEGYGETAGHRRTAAMHDDYDAESAFGDYTLRHRTEDQGERKPRHIIEAYAPDGSIAGRLNWYGTSGVIHHIEVAREEDDGQQQSSPLGNGQNHQRRGLATAMWNWGREIHPKLRHSGDRTPQGADWAKAVGGPGLRSHKGSAKREQHEVVAHFEGGPWYHASTDELEDGATVQTAAQLGRETRGGPGDEHKVWISNDPYRAGAYGAHIYEVRPHTQPRHTRGPDDEHETAQATVVRKVPYQEAQQLSTSYQEQAAAYAKAREAEGREVVAHFGEDMPADPEIPYMKPPGAGAETADHILQYHTGLGHPTNLSREDLGLHGDDKHWQRWHDAEHRHRVHQDHQHLGPVGTPGEQHWPDTFQPHETYLWPMSDRPAGWHPESHGGFHPLAPAEGALLRHFAVASPDELPPDPGTQPIPEGHVRLWHYTPNKNVASIREHGLQRKYAQGDAMNGDLSDPSAGMWASTKQPDELLDSHDSAKSVVEFHAHPREISGNAESPWQAERRREPGQAWEDREYNPEKLADWASGYHHVIMHGDVHPSQILAIHEPWHAAARYMRDDPAGPASYQWVRDEHAAGGNDHLEPYVRGLDALERHPKTAAAEVVAHFDDHEEWERREIPPYTGQPLFHGTRSILLPGETITHEQAAEHANNPDIHAEPFVHATSSGAEAHQWGERASSASADARMEPLGRQQPVRPGYNQDHAYPPRVYQVEPTGDVEPDPHKEGASYRSAAPMRVVREVRPLSCYAEECDNAEHWPDHPHYETLRQEQEEDEDGGEDGRTAALQATAALENPYTGRSIWYHGTQAHPEDIRQHGLHDASEFAHGRFEVPESETDDSGHWNAMLGVHFTADHAIAGEFARGEHEGSDNEGYGGEDEEHHGIIHAHVHLNNPKFYGSEHDLDHDAYEHEFAAGNHPQNHHPGLGKHYEGEPDFDDPDVDERLNAEEMWPHAHRVAQDFGREKIPASTYGHHNSPFDQHPMRTAWLNTHPDKYAIAMRHKKRLEDQGYDGIVYRNEYEKSNRGGAANTSIVAFHPEHQVEITQHHDADRATEDPDPEPRGHLATLASLEHPAPSFTWRHETYGPDGGYVTKEDRVEGPFYHGGRANLKPGGMIKPGQKPNSWGDTFDDRGRSVYTYFAHEPGTATSYARETGGHMYEVEPTGEVSFDGSGGDGSWKSKHPLRVIRKVPQHEWDALPSGRIRHEAAMAPELVLADKVADAVPAPAAPLALWRAESPEEARGMLGDLPGFFSSVAGSLDALAGRFDDSPADPRCAGIIRKMADACRLAEDDAREIVARLPAAEGVCEDSPGPGPKA